jgi:hypothetical protein
MTGTTTVMEDIMNGFAWGCNGGEAAETGVGPETMSHFVRFCLNFGKKFGHF